MSLFETTGCLFIAPGGNNERPESWGTVLEWGALNIGAEAAHDPDWNRQRTLMAGAGVVAFPWLHCRTTGDLDRLLAKADAWGTRNAGVNIEDVVADNLSVPAVASTLERWGGNALIITLPWLQNGQGWSSLREYPFALEYFPFDPSWDPVYNNRAALVEHACAEIGQDAQLTWLYGTYPPDKASPDNYDLEVAHSFYTAEDIGSTPAQWNKWAGPTLAPFVRCSGDNGPVTPIGPQDGIKAKYNRLRDLDPGGTILVKQGGKWPDLSTIAHIPLEQWKAYDKAQRTDQILKDDHDA